MPTSDCSGRVWLTILLAAWSEPERFELRLRQRDPRDGVDAALRKILPGPFNLWSRHPGLPEKIGEPVQALALGMASAKLASQRREDDPILGIDGIDMAMHSGDVKKPYRRAVH